MSSVEELDQTLTSVPTEAFNTSLNTKPTERKSENNSKMGTVTKEVRIEQTDVMVASSGPGLYSFLLSVVRKMVMIGSIYMVGYMGWSVGWLAAPLLLSIVKDIHQTSLRKRISMAKTYAMTPEKHIILGRLDDLPAWVYFPDVERCEWVNSIVKQIWPNANYFARDLIKTEIEANIATALANYKLHGFRFDRIVLGTIPPRIGGVKIYEHNVDRNEIIMDLDLFYASDCDINFYLSGMKGGIRDFQIFGRVRVVMKPLIKSMPLIGGLQIFFLNNPNVEFHLVGIMDVLDMPGLHEILKRTIIMQIGAIMVLPNKMSITLSDDIEAVALKMPEPEGVLRIHVVEAKNLMQMDFGVLKFGKSDPYTIINVGSEEFKTQVIENTLDPKWDFWCEWLVLEQAKHGLLHVRLSWHTLSSNPHDLKHALMETQQLRVTAMSTALLIVFVDSAKNLPQPRVGSNPDAYCTLSVGKKTEQTAVEMRNDSPVWEQGFTFLVANPDHDSLHLKVVDSKTGSEIGELSIILNTLLSKENMQIVSQPFQLQNSGPESQITLSLELRILKRGEPEDDDLSSDKHSMNESLSRTSMQSTQKSDTANVGQKNTTAVPTNSSSSKQDSKQKTAKDFAEDLIPEEEFISLKNKASTAFPVRIKQTSNPESVLTHRNPDTTSTAGEYGLGRIQLTIHYNIARQKLFVTVHKIMNIPLNDPSNIPDPYVKLYLLPARSKDSKRKTFTVKDNCNPVYEATFDYVISSAELYQTHLEVTVCTQKGFRYGGSPIIGMLKIALGEPEISGSGISSWFDLQPEVKNE